MEIKDRDYSHTNKCNFLSSYSKYTKAFFKVSVGRSITTTKQVFEVLPYGNDRLYDYFKQEVIENLYFIQICTKTSLILYEIINNSKCIIPRNVFCTNVPDIQRVAISSATFWSCRMSSLMRFNETLPKEVICSPVLMLAVSYFTSYTWSFFPAQLRLRYNVSRHLLKCLSIFNR